MPKELLILGAILLIGALLAWVTFRFRRIRRRRLWQSKRPIHVKVGTQLVEKK